MISLSDLRARRVTPAWQEAVAVVQELLESATADGSLDRLPDVDQIALMADGQVVALPGGRTVGHPVCRAADLLNQLLDGTAAPAELRTLVEANLTDPPRLATAADLARQLAFFERPGRRTDVQQLVSRAMSMEAQDRAEEELQRLKLRALEAQALAAFQTETPGPSRRRIGRQAAIALALGAAVVVAALGWWVVGLIGGRLASEETSVRSVVVLEGEAAVAALDESHAGEVEGESAVEGSAGTAESEPMSLLDRTKDTLSRAVRRVLGSGTEGETARAEVPEANVASVESAPVSGGARRPARQPPAPAQVMPEPPQVIAESAPPMTEDPLSIGGLPTEHSVIYSAGDDDVLPAVLVRPVLPASPPPDVKPDQIGTLELIVDENGDVERVRLISPSNRYHERMLVANAKTWKFRPALRDGRPVKYRAVVRLTI